jgi:membrane associated rhomboid family serine protease
MIIGPSSIRVLFLVSFVFRNEARVFVPTAAVTTLSIPSGLDGYAQALERGQIFEALRCDPRITDEGWRFRTRDNNSFVIDTRIRETYSLEFYEDQSLSLFQLISRAIVPFYRRDPISFVVLATCMSIFVMWQIPSCQGFLERYFILSRRRIFPNILTSTVSHANLVHLFCNIVAFLHFAPVVQRALSQSSWTFWLFLIGAALVSSTTFVTFSTQPGLGLSGVTMALLAFYCKLYPQASVGIYMAGIIPLRIPAHQLLVSSLLSSVLGTLFDTPYQRSRVAHASHLGGLLFGVGYFELWKQKLLVKGKAARSQAWNSYSLF